MPHGLGRQIGRRGRERLYAGLLVVGNDRHLDPEPPFELDGSLEIAQDMRVAKGVIDLAPPAIGHEMVMHDEPPANPRGCHRALPRR